MLKGREMFRSYPDILLRSISQGTVLKPTTAGQSGIAMVVSLILLLVITLMGLGIAYVANVQSDMVAAVVNKPVSIDVADTCFDHALEWIETSAGRSWLAGDGAPKDLAAIGGPLANKSLQIDTVPVGQSDNRSAAFVNNATRASYSSCVVQILKSDTSVMTDINVGNEIGTSNGYGASKIYTIRVTGQGDYNVPTQGSWQSSASRSVVEVVVQFAP